MRKLQDNFQCFQDKLVDREVYSSFTSITNKAKKFAKPETKVDINIIYTCMYASVLLSNCSNYICEFLTSEEEIFFIL